jgi:polyisoprenoid-binding protein YceI
MNRLRRSRIHWFTPLAAAAMAAMIWPAAWAAEKRVTLDPAKSTVTFTLEATAHEVEGVLALKSGEITFDPDNGSASGDIVIQLAGGKTGNERRDRKMHAEVLETSKFPSATFRLNKVTGTFVAEGESKLGLEGVLNLHGADHPLTLQAHVTTHAGHVTAKIEVPIPFVAWGLQDPSVFVLRVAKEVAVHVVAEGTIQ